MKVHLNLYACLLLCLFLANANIWAQNSEEPNKCNFSIVKNVFSGTKTTPLIKTKSLYDCFNQACTTFFEDTKNTKLNITYLGSLGRGELTETETEKGTCTIKIDFNKPDTSTNVLLEECFKNSIKLAKKKNVAEDFLLFLTFTRSRS